MEFGEGDFQRAFLGFRSETEYNTWLNTFITSSAISGVKWYANNYDTVKKAYELYKSTFGQTQMARYRKRGFKRRRVHGRKKRYGRRKYGRRGGLGRRVRSISRFLRNKGLRNIETKYFDIHADPTAPQYAYRWDVTRDPQITFTQDILQGNQYDMREGAKIFVRKIRMYAMFTASSTSSYPEQYIRWFVVRDKRPDSSTVIPKLGDILYNEIATSASSQAYGNLALMTFKEINNRQAGRFQFLAQGMHKVVNESGTGEKTVLWKKTISVRQPCYYGTSTGANDLGCGHIYFFAYSSDGSSVDANYPLMQYACRVYFTDC